MKNSSSVSPEPWTENRKSEMCKLSNQSSDSFKRRTFQKSRLCACVSAGAGRCTCDLNVTWVCAGVYLGRKPGLVRRGENVRQTKIMFRVFILFVYIQCSFLSPCVKDFFSLHFFIVMLCIPMNNKDWFGIFNLFSLISAEGRERDWLIHKPMCHFFLNYALHTDEQ